MAHVVLFHSGLGLRPHVKAFQEELEADGHRVTTPDLYRGEVFDTLKEGVRMRDEIGIPELSRRAQEAVEGLPADLIYAGFSMGAASAQALALTRRGARGLVLMHAALPLQAFGGSTWPQGLKAQFHGAVGDPWVDRGVVSALREASEGGLETFAYEGEAHLFADDGLPEYDPQLANQMLSRVRRFMSEL